MLPFAVNILQFFGGKTNMSRYLWRLNFTTTFGEIVKNLNTLSEMSRGRTTGTGK